jgi:hypothetical protein
MRLKQHRGYLHNPKLMKILKNPMFQLPRNGLGREVTMILILILLLPVQDRDTTCACKTLLFSVTLLPPPLALPLAAHKKSFRGSQSHGWRI